MNIADQIWDSKYRLKKFDGTPVDLTVDDTWRRVASALASCEPENQVATRRAEFFAVMKAGYFSPAGRIIAGAGTGRNVTLSNCFTMGTIPDSMEGIFESLKEAALTMQQGGGIGYDFSPIRPKGAEVKGVQAGASGPLSFMDVWDAMCRTVMSAGSRRGAMMATMRCDHPDIFDFVNAKKDPARLRMFNLSVLVTDAFMDAVKNGDAWRLHFENGKGECVSEKWVEGRDLWNAIMRSTYAQAEPGVIFIDRMNADHNLGYLETIATTNPCGEKGMGPYASCLLGSINVAKLIDKAFTEDSTVNWHMLINTVHTAIRMMDNVIEVGNFPLTSQLEKAKEDRQLGLGVTGLADALIMMDMEYGSDEAVEFTESLMKEIALAAYNASVELAIERGAFPTFNAAEFLSQTRFAGRMLPSVLRNKIRIYGIRNGLLLSIAPTGTISLFAGNVSSGIEPIFAPSYTRKVLQADGTRTEERVEDYAVAAYRKHFYESVYDPSIHPSSEWSDDYLPHYFVTAQDLSPAAHIRMQAAVQKWVDSSISKTVNLPEDISFEDFEAVYLLAYASGCKGCTTYRPNDITGSVLSVDAPKSVDEESTSTVVFTGVFDTHTRAELKSLAEAAGWKVSGSVSAKATLVVCGAGAGSKKSKADELGIRTCEIAEFLSSVTPKSVTKPDPIVTVAIPVRPSALDGKTYKMKWPGDTDALYVTINDDDDGNPFELFLNTKNINHHAWMAALARTISAVFRRGGDVTFIAHELREVFDPKGGAWINKKYVPSMIAAIGDVILNHIEGEIDAPSIAQEVEDEDIHHVAVRAGKCPSCAEFAMKNEGGCETCASCGHSKCG